MVMWEGRKPRGLCIICIVVENVTYSQKQKAGWRKEIKWAHVCVTFVIPRTPIFGLEEVEPFPVPKRPSSTQEIPSTNIPLQRKTNQLKYLPDSKLPVWRFVNKLKCQREWRRTAVRRTEELPIDGMDGRRRSTRETRAGVVISNRLDDAGHHRAHHADHTCSCYSGNAPLDCRRENTVWVI